MTIFLLCSKIFLVRIIDVSLGTIRTIVTVKNKKLLASIIGFFEVLVWFLIAKEALNIDSKSILVAISYSLGFASGTYIGSYLSEKYIRGDIEVQIITDNLNLIEYLRTVGYAVSVIDVQGQDKTKDKYMLLIGIDKNDFDKIRKIIKDFDKKAFVIVKETRNIYNGYFSK